VALTFNPWFRYLFSSDTTTTNNNNNNTSYNRSHELVYGADLWLQGLQVFTITTTTTTTTAGSN